MGMSQIGPKLLTGRVDAGQISVHVVVAKDRLKGKAVTYCDIRHLKRIRIRLGGCRTAVIDQVQVVHNILAEIRTYLVNFESPLSFA